MLLVAPLLLSGACSGLQERVEDVRSGSQELTDRARFCLSVVRAANALEGGDHTTAADAAQEALAQAPEELRGDARTVAEAAETVRQGDRSVLQDPTVVAAAERLQDDTRALCDPTG
ncbi:hypothetical protein GCM10011354_00860 [Egicoccus halophilus]|uniref:Uncharacterized protein n=1 Tax=Egicoccus halophilus TaxID=1670830 RepID=A0A8J3A6X4_9ACTN|nr:hypothetical protein GCM10011354_00860 [Egicoccus halophilus]